MRDLVERRIGELAAATAQAWGCKAEAYYHRGTSPLVNEAEQVRVGVAAATAAVGAEKVNGQLRPGTGGEDFAEMMLVRPGAFMRIGNGVNPDGSFVGLHTPLYDFNDAIIPNGVRYWVGLVDQELGQGLRAVAAE